MLEILVGLKVVDDEGYRKYRNKMKPILFNMGGGFRYDFIVSETCNLDISNQFHHQMDSSINRVFIIHFPNQKVRDDFFNNEDYKKIKKKYFDRSVTSTKIIAEWNTD